YWRSACKPDLPVPDVYRDERRNCSRLGVSLEPTWSKTGNDPTHSRDVLSSYGTAQSARKAHRPSAEWTRPHAPRAKQKPTTVRRVDETRLCLAVIRYQP